MSCYHDKAVARAIELGAVKEAREFYPAKRQYMGVAEGWKEYAEVFAVRFFNAEYEEVGYYLPDMEPFHDDGHLHEFSPPRVWSECFLMQLGGFKWIT